MVEVAFGGTLRSAMAYNALHWRTLKVADATGTGNVPDGSVDQVRLMYHGPDWRLLEERVDKDAASTTTLTKVYDGTWALSGVDRRHQYLWGPRYIDDLLLHRIDRNKDGDYVDSTDGTWYHLTDAPSNNRASSVCLRDKTAKVVERVTYSAYGVARHLWALVVEGEGDVDTSRAAASDKKIVSDIAGGGHNTIGDTAGTYPYRAEADLNRDGVVNATDTAAVTPAQAALAAGRLSSIDASRGPDNVIGWDGYVANQEAGVLTVRFRSYEPGLGRWMERDPKGYAEHTSLFDGFGSSPCDRVDPTGLSDEPGWTRRPGVAGNPPTNPCSIVIDVQGTHPGSLKMGEAGIEPDFDYITTIHPEALRVSGVSDAIQKIQAVAQHCRSRSCCSKCCVRLLRFHGHGLDGLINLWGDQQYGTDGESSFFWRTTGSNLDRLAELDEYLCDDAEVQFLGCNVGAAYFGGRFLEKAQSVLGKRRRFVAYRCYLQGEEPLEPGMLRYIGPDGVLNPPEPTPQILPSNDATSSIPKGSCACQ